MDLYLFAEGNHRDLSSCLGATDDGRRRRWRAFRRVGAECRRVSVVGDFNVWDGRRHPMRLRHPTGSGSFHSAPAGGEAYKYEILGKDGILPLKADPMALATSLPPDTASKVAHR
jgi:1,4-alpha-glucan branching enzyme